MLPLNNVLHECTNVIRTDLVTAFENFQRATPQPASEQFMIPQLNEAFEKFMGERRASPSAD